MRPDTLLPANHRQLKHGTMGNAAHGRRDLYHNRWEYPPEEQECAGIATKQQSCKALMANSTSGTAVAVLPRSALARTSHPVCSSITTIGSLNEPDAWHQSTL